MVSFALFKIQSYFILPPYSLPPYNLLSYLSPPAHPMHSHLEGWLHVKSGHTFFSVVTTKRASETQIFPVAKSMTPCLSVWSSLPVCCCVLPRCLYSLCWAWTTPRRRWVPLNTNLCLFVCVCMHVHRHAQGCTYMHAHMYACVFLYVWEHMHVCASACGVQRITLVVVPLPLSTLLLVKIASHWPELIK